MSNKRKILIYLIPVKMFLGHMPTSQLLHEYRLDEFQDVVAGVKGFNLKKTTFEHETFSDGNLAQLDGALAANEAFFIKCGIFLMLEKLRMITFRTLFKKV